MARRVIRSVSRIFVISGARSATTSMAFLRRAVAEWTTPLARPPDRFRHWGREAPSLTPRALALAKASLVNVLFAMFLSRWWAFVAFRHTREPFY